VTKVGKDLLVRMDALDQRDHQVHREAKENEVNVDKRVHKDVLEPLVILEPADLWVPLVKLVRQVLLAVMVPRVILDSSDHLDLKEVQEKRVMKVNVDRPDHLDPREIADQTDTEDPVDLLVRLDLRALLDQPDLKLIRDQWDLVAT
jgi:hypothetical protein